MVVTHHHQVDNGQPPVRSPISSEYFKSDILWAPGDRVSLHLNAGAPLPPTRWCAKTWPRCRRTGNLVYCLEQQDQAAGGGGRSLYARPARSKANCGPNLLGGVLVLQHQGVAAARPLNTQPLYGPAQARWSRYARGGNVNVPFRTMPGRIASRSRWWCRCHTRPTPSTSQVLPGALLVVVLLMPGRSYTRRQSRRHARNWSVTPTSVSASRREAEAPATGRRTWTIRGIALGGRFAASPGKPSELRAGTRDRLAVSRRIAGRDGGGLPHQESQGAGAGRPRAGAQSNEPDGSCDCWRPRRRSGTLRQGRCAFPAKRQRTRRQRGGAHAVPGLPATFGVRAANAAAVVFERLLREGARRPALHHNLAVAQLQGARDRSGAFQRPVTAVDASPRRRSPTRSAVSPRQTRRQGTCSPAQRNRACARGGMSIWPLSVWWATQPAGPGGDQRRRVAQPEARPACTRCEARSRDQRARRGGTGFRACARAQPGRTLRVRRPRRGAAADRGSPEAIAQASQEAGPTCRLTRRSTTFSLTP